MFIIRGEKFQSNRTGPIAKNLKEKACANVILRILIRCCNSIADIFTFPLGLLCDCGEVSYDT